MDRMAIPRSLESRRFFQVAFQRFEDAQILLRNARTTGAVYLAGYAVECILKVLLLESVPISRRRHVVASFRGTKAHDFEWIRNELRSRNVLLPGEIGRALATVRTWSVDLRYVAANWAQADAQAFLTAANRIVKWVEGKV
jgi:HEPN domain-containing protein